MGELLPSGEVGGEVEGASGFAEARVGGEDGEAAGGVRGCVTGANSVRHLSTKILTQC
jgi:hypothetical protein